MTPFIRITSLEGIIWADELLRSAPLNVARRAHPPMLETALEVRDQWHLGADNNGVNYNVIFCLLTAVLGQKLLSLSDQPHDQRPYHTSGLLRLGCKQIDPLA
jgi:hypothetical protein